MKIGMIGMGRMGAAMARRIKKAGHTPVVYDASETSLKTARSAGLETAVDLKSLVAALSPPRAIWMMIPAGAVDDLLSSLAPQLSRKDRKSVV